MERLTRKVLYNPRCTIHIGRQDSENKDLWVKAMWGWTPVLENCLHFYAQFRSLQIAPRPGCRVSSRIKFELKYTAIGGKSMGLEVRSWLPPKLCSLESHLES